MTNFKVTRLFLAIFIIILLLLFLTILGCTAQKAEPSKLKIAALPYLSFSTFYISQEEGYFAEQGLDVEFVKFPTVTQSIPLVAQGDLDVAGGPVSASLINVISQNMRLRVVAGKVHTPSDCETVALVVRKDLYESGELDTVAEIKGRKVAISSIGSIQDFFLAKTLGTASLTLDDVELVKLSPQDNYAAFDNRAIALAVTGPPHIQQLNDLGYAVTLESDSKLMPGFQLSYIIFGPSLLDDNRELGNRFMIAYLQGLRQYAQGKTERNLEIIEKYIGLDKETLLNMCWSPAYRDGHIIVEDILTYQDWLYESGLVDEKVAGEQLVDTSFIDYANKELGPPH